MHPPSPQTGSGTPYPDLGVNINRFLTTPPCTPPRTQGTPSIPQPHPRWGGGPGFPLSLPRFPAGKHRRGCRLPGPGCGGRRGARGGLDGTGALRCAALSTSRAAAPCTAAGARPACSLLSSRQPGMEPMLKRLQKPSREDVDPPPQPRHAHALASGFLGTRKGRCLLCLVCTPGAIGCSAPTCHRTVMCSGTAPGAQRVLGCGRWHTAARCAWVSGPIDAAGLQRGLE